MTKWIKFEMSRGNSVSLPADMAERLIDRDGQLMKIPDKDGTWSGKLINKAHIVSTDRDIKKEQTEAEHDRLKTPKLAEVKNPEAVKNALNILKKEVFKNRIVTQLNCKCGSTNIITTDGKCPECVDKNFKSITKRD